MFEVPEHVAREVRARREDRVRVPAMLDHQFGRIEVPVTDEPVGELGQPLALVRQLRAGRRTGVDDLELCHRSSVAQFEVWGSEFDV